jgi:hypothetical protein
MGAKSRGVASNPSQGDLSGDYNVTRPIEFTPDCHRDVVRIKISEPLVEVSGIVVGAQLRMRLQHLCDFTEYQPVPEYLGNVLLHAVKLAPPLFPLLLV